MLQARLTYRHQKGRIMKKLGLYDPQFEHDAYGVGFVGRLDGRSEHQVVKMSLS
jgi:hypothetical protein